ncbi:MAG: nickel-dependent lactate racemase [Deltaproteobacteria bacterium]|nr:nickel-dependent lactate racemase [Deltaproteobacteria bacterium]
MKARLSYGSDIIEVEIPDGTTIYETSYPRPLTSAREIVLEALRRPAGFPSLKDALKQRRPGDVVIVVSDNTRPVPYINFLKTVIEEIQNVGVKQGEILILIATGDHRPCTHEEQLQMFGDEICRNYRIIHHSAGDDSELIELAGRSWAGKNVRINRHFVGAGFRIITGLVEPHFMAGFSGGRKSICPGLVSRETLDHFHGYTFLADPFSQNGQIEKNPIHLEALSVARLAGVDFSLNIVINRSRDVVAAFGGDLEASHLAACEYVRKVACPEVIFEHDIVLTSCGGHPLDATFYQCVKGITSCLSAVRNGGVIIAVGSCSEGIGSPEYEDLIFEYSGRWRMFLNQIKKRPQEVRKDQWEFQMQTRALQKVGMENLYFLTDGLTDDKLLKLSVTAVNIESNIRKTLQMLLERQIRGKRSLAVIPEGPYCAPVKYFRR